MESKALQKKASLKSEMEIQSLLFSEADTDVVMLKYEFTFKNFGLTLFRRAGFAESSKVIKGGAMANLKNWLRQHAEVFCRFAI